jgi:hypothetical protein
MKKSLMLGLFSLVIGLNSSFGQSLILLRNSTSSLVTYGPNVYADGVSGPYGTVGAGLDSSWTVGFYYAIGVVAADATAGSGHVSPLLSLATGPNSTAVFEAYEDPGEFFSLDYFHTGAPYGSTITVELVAYPTVAGSYESLFFDGPFGGQSGDRGHSAAFTMVMQTQPIDFPKEVGDYFSSFAVTPIPEPSTLALAGLSGAMLMVLRRKAA